MAVIVWCNALALVMGAWLCQSGFQMWFAVVAAMAISVPISAVRDAVVSTFREGESS